MSTNAESLLMISPYLLRYLVGYANFGYLVLS